MRKRRTLDSDQGFMEPEDLTDPDMLVLSGVGTRRVMGLAETLDNLNGVYVQSSRTVTRDVTLSPLVDADDLPVRKTECKAPKHEGERVLPVRFFTTDPNTPNGYDRWCRKCRAAAARQRRKVRKQARATSAAPSAPVAVLTN